MFFIIRISADYRSINSVHPLVWCFEKIDNFNLVHFPAFKSGISLTERALGCYLIVFNHPKQLSHSQSDNNTILPNSIFCIYLAPYHIHLLYIPYMIYCFSNFSNHKRNTRVFQTMVSILGQQLGELLHDFARQGAHLFVGQKGFLQHPGGKHHRGQVHIEKPRGELFPSRRTYFWAKGTVGPPLPTWSRRRAWWQWPADSVGASHIFPDVATATFRCYRLLQQMMLFHDVFFSPCFSVEFSQSLFSNSKAFL